MSIPGSDDGIHGEPREFRYGGEGFVFPTRRCVPVVGALSTGVGETGGGCGDQSGRRLGQVSHSGPVTDTWQPRAVTRDSLWRTTNVAVKQVSESQPSRWPGSGFLRWTVVGMSRSSEKLSAAGGLSTAGLSARRTGQPANHSPGAGPFAALLTAQRRTFHRIRYWTYGYFVVQLTKTL